MTYVVSDTGPLISAYQSNSMPILMTLFAGISISPACASELKAHGWEGAMNATSSQLTITQLTSHEEIRALEIATQIAEQPESRNPDREHHLGESQAIILVQRKVYRNHVLLLDERAARIVARQLKIKLSGFPGVLLLASQVRLITAEEVKARLEMCLDKGTHYSTTLIQDVYAMAKHGRRSS